MSVNLSSVFGAGAQLFTDQGVVLAGGLLYTYQAGTTTPQATFTDSTGTVQNSNPVVLTSSGRVPYEIWLTSGELYKFVLKSSAGVSIANGTWDNITGTNDAAGFHAQYALEQQIATAGQTVFNLSNSYVPAGNTLVVYTNGKKDSITLDYTESGVQQVTFLVGKNVGDVVEFYIGLGITTVATLASQTQYIPAGTGAVATDVQTKLRESVSVKDFGATIASSDNTTAFQAALDSGALTVVIPADGTYITGPVTTTKVGQKIIAYGATVKLKAASTNALFKTTAAGVEVFGGIWDCNNVSQSGIALGADYCSVRFATLQNCGAAGVYGYNNANFLTISDNTIKDAVTYGIYVECLTADSYGNKIINNVVDTSATVAASGIYLTGTNAQTFFQRQWQIKGNKCKGIGATATGAGITARAVDGILNDNIVSGYDLNITADIITRSIISNNRCSDPGTATGYNIEVNGGYNVISGNYCKNGKYGIIGSGASAPTMDYNKITDNVIENSTGIGIRFIPSGANTAKYLSITGNNIDLSGSGTGTIPIYLSNNCSHSNIFGNTLHGLGSGTANTYAVFLDTPPAAAFINISGNTCVGFFRAFGVYSAGALTVTDLTSNGNDLSSDVTQSTVGWAFIGSATVGTRVTHTGSKNVNGSYTEVHDMLLNVFTLRSTSFNSPEGGLTAGIGSLYISLNSGQVPYIKSTGANTNTGWVAL